MKVKILLVFLLLLSISGCGKQKLEGDEVVLGQDCGMEDLQCCQDKPQCLQGLQCCVSPFNTQDTYCAVDCNMGQKDAFCRQDKSCDDGLVCENNRCLPCGKDGEPCCVGGLSCTEGLICENKKCSKCGQNNQPCCADNTCQLGKGKQHLECQSNLCQYCGFDGFRVCLQGEKCLPGQIYSGDYCYQCGSINQPCCGSDSAVDYKCKPAQGLVCQLGFCVKDDK